MNEDLSKKIKVITDKISSNDNENDLLSSLDDLIDEENRIINNDDFNSFCDDYSINKKDASLLKNTFISSGYSFIDDLENDEDIDEIEEDSSNISFDDIKATDDIKQYYKNISKYKLLTPKEELELAKRIKAGDEEAKERFIAANARLVIAMAKKFLNSNIPFQDLIQEGNAGLIHAAEKFDYTKGLKFSTYATWWIKQAMLKAINEQNRNIRIPAHVIEVLNKVNKTKNLLIQELGREPTSEEIFEKLNKRIPLEKIDACLLLSKDTISLETSLGDDSGTELGDVVPDKREISPLDFAISSEQKEIVDEALKQLDEREEKILRLRYGFDDGVERTLSEIGKMYNLSRERIRQIETKALFKLRKILEDKDFYDIREN